MKKVLSLFLVMFLSLFIFTGCEEEWKEPVDDTTFEEYLVASNAIDSEALDEIVVIEENSISLDAVKVNKTKVSVSTIMDLNEAKIDAVLWQEEKVVYCNMTQQGQTQLFKLDLAALEAMIDTTQTQDMSFSELVNLLLAEATGGNKLTLDAILDAVELTIADFEDLGDGKYQLKNSAILRIVANLTGEELPENAEEMFFGEYDDFAIVFEYRNGKIRSINFELGQENAEQEAGFKSASMNASVSFGYDELGLSQFNVDFSFKQYSFESETPVIDASLSLKLGDEFGLDVKLKVDNVDVTLELSKDKLVVDADVVVDDQTYKLDGSLTFANNWITGGNVSFSMIQDSVESKLLVSITSNDSVEIPTVDKQLALDILTLLQQQAPVL